MYARIQSCVRNFSYSERVLRGDRVENVLRQDDGAQYRNVDNFVTALRMRKSTEEGTTTVESAMEGTWEMSRV